MDKKVKSSKLDEDNDSEHEVNKIARTAKEIQKVQIENLMKRIDKPIVLPENKGVVLKPPKDFIRNIQGSSAGAGSGEFHVYRALRRKELMRLKLMNEEIKKEQDQKEFDDKMNKLKEIEDKKTEKRRKKRQKQKESKKRKLIKEEKEKDEIKTEKNKNDQTK
ncbi:DUF1168-domain-containing protein [Neocallimastix lanati (nom. inval.)]|uniref:DUF1168-domain-containing protein n=1 Tax=Neocallimastix californiae TaxID=1754190 RepID=A0A1Y2ALA6_9FUNG|nr:DUF1168-domain-containing protein [Neocallimastix sp. JGI-2020a]ORY23007.1 DUF1168-domain-containing protein [Neocallimastix californiae]|eukprot:ORY23007.1 DUF1168-domain-containing protein [Neocallimastix californiae]